MHTKTQPRNNGQATILPKVGRNGLIRDTDINRSFYRACDKADARYEKAMKSIDMLLHRLEATMDDTVRRLRKAARKAHQIEMRMADKLWKAA